MHKGIAVMLVACCFIGSSCQENSGREPQPLDDFVECLNDYGLKLWYHEYQSYSQMQTEIFGESFDLLNAHSCWLYNEKKDYGSPFTWTQECRRAKVWLYPTWDLPDGRRILKLLTLEVLEELTGCPLPEEDELVTE